MLASLRRLPAALLLACAAAALTLPTASVAAAGPALGPALGPGKDADRADLVFSGTVTEVTGTKKKPVYAVQADRIWKGSLTTADLEIQQQSRRCALDLRADTDYVFFVTEEGVDLLSGDCAGTAKATAQLTGKLDSVLGESEPVDSPEPEKMKPTFTPVEGGQPYAFTRVAAPGAALVLVGLLGLLVVRRAARR